MSNTEIAQILLDVKAVHLSPDDPFTWTSGIKSPIYCDNRQIISYPEHRKIIANEFAKIIKRDYPQVQVIAGTATAGIPHAAFVAEALNLPMIYVRSSSKGHGLENLIEGKLDKDSKVVVIEDMVSTGKSSVAAVKAVEEAGAKVLKTYSIFTYGLQKSENAFKEINHSYQALCTVDTLLDVAENNKNITNAQAQIVREFIKSLD
jgi:orotate phosphoribosyltransferase